MDMQIVISSEWFNIWFLPEKIKKPLENLIFEDFWRFEVFKLKVLKAEDARQPEDDEIEIRRL